MNIANFLNSYNQTRNGVNARIRHPLVRNFVYSDGVAECADAGCHWLLDIVATEGIDFMRKNAAVFNGVGFVRVEVSDQSCEIYVESDVHSEEWNRTIEFTDLPDGTFQFMLTDEGDHFFMILMSEY